MLSSSKNTPRTAGHHAFCACHGKLWTPWLESVGAGNIVYCSLVLAIYIFVGHNWLFPVYLFPALDLCLSVHLYLYHNISGELELGRLLQFYHFIFNLTKIKLTIILSPILFYLTWPHQWHSALHCLSTYVHSVQHFQNAFFILLEQYQTILTAHAHAAAYVIVSKQKSTRPFYLWTNHALLRSSKPVV
jgi:hypothetical protein